MMCLVFTSAREGGDRRYSAAGDAERLLAYKIQARVTCDMWRVTCDV
jgi:hypothetical protein